MYKEATVTW